MSELDRRSNRISLGEILDLGDYERGRTEIRSRAMEARRLRRVELGPNATVAFENRLTVVYQIQEMLRAERIARDAEVQHEIETYSDLLPSEDELSATLMFEFTEVSERPVNLMDLIGFEDHLRLEIDGAGPSVARFDRRQLDLDRISSVQFIRFALDEKQRQALSGGAGARLVADHRRYAYTAELPPELRRALADDLKDDGHG